MLAEISNPDFRIIDWDAEDLKPEPDLSFGMGKRSQVIIGVALIALGALALGGFFASCVFFPPVSLATLAAVVLPSVITIPLSIYTMLGGYIIVSDAFSRQ